jgi:hypothetical protein
MRRVAAEAGFTSPTCSTTQAVAKAYDAVAREFFGFNAASSSSTAVSDVKTARSMVRRELFDAMLQIARTGQGPAEQTAAIGCSIKWKHA